MSQTYLISDDAEEMFSIYYPEQIKRTLLYILRSLINVYYSFHFEKNGYTKKAFLHEHFISHWPFSCFVSNVMTATLHISWWVLKYRTAWHCSWSFKTIINLYNLYVLLSLIKLTQFNIPVFFFSVHNHSICKMPSGAHSFPLLAWHFYIS